MRNETQNKGIWKNFISMLVKARLPWLWIILSIALSLGYSSLTLMFPDYTERVIGGDLTGSTITMFVLVLIGTLLVSIVSSWIQGITAAKITKSMRTSVWDMITRLPMRNLEEKGSKELISRTTTDTVAVGNLFASTIPGILATVYYIWGSAVAVNEYDFSLVLILLGLVVVQLILSIISGRIVYSYNKRVQEKLAYMTESVSEVMSNISLVKIFTAQEKEKARGKAFISDYNKTSFTAQNVANIFYYLTRLVNVMGYLVVIIAGGAMVKNGTIGIEAWIAYFMYYYYLAMDIIMLPYYWRELKGIQGAASRMSSLYTMEQEDVETGEELQARNQDLAVKDLTFGYEEKNILNGLSAKLEYGKTYALVGENGAGKSTLFNLIERLYLPKEGSIIYGTQDACSVKLSSWRKLFGYVPQDVKLMGGTIRDNVTYGVKKNVTDAELKELCEKVDLTEYLETLPKGIDSEVDDFGENMSGGQRQKIAIARALLMDAEILLLDEFTSNLDVESENRIDNVIEKLKGEKTILMITHSRNLAKKADHILELKDGKILTEGGNYEG